MRRHLARLGRFLAKVLLVDVILAALAVGVCWVLGWRSLDRYGMTLVGAGLLALVVAGPSVFGSMIVLGSPITWYVQSVMPGTPRQRLRAMLDEPDSGPGLVLMATVAASLIGAGVWVWSLA